MNIKYKTFLFFEEEYKLDSYWWLQVSFLWRAFLRLAFKNGPIRVGLTVEAGYFICACTVADLLFSMGGVEANALKIKYSRYRVTYIYKPFY